MENKYLREHGQITSQGLLRGGAIRNILTLHLVKQLSRWQMADSAGGAFPIRSSGYPDFDEAELSAYFSSPIVLARCAHLDRSAASVLKPPGATAMDLSDQHQCLLVILHEAKFHLQRQ